MNNFIIAIDAGHGVNGDPGAVHRTSGRRECDDTFRLSLAIYNEAQRRGIGAIMTRTLENSPKIDRSGIAIKAGAGVFLCVHRNGFNSSAKGFETWLPPTYSAKTGQLANAIQNKCVAAGVLANRGVKHDTKNDYPLINTVEKAGIPAVLIEYGFVDNTEDNAIFDKNFDNYVKATVDAVVETFGLAETTAKGGLPAGASPLTAIAGNSVATAAQMNAYIQRMNPAIDISGLIALYLSEGAAEGIRGDIAFAQSCLETGFFKFSGGTAVTFEQNNFCGMGVVQTGIKGNVYATPQEGIRAQIQHLKAYANELPLNNPLVVPLSGEIRFKYVVRGCAPYVEWLGQKENPQGRGWAVGAGYGAKILQILRDIIGAGGVAPTGEPPSAEGEIVTEPIPAPFQPYGVWVTENALNVRETPPVEPKITGVIKDRGKYTIVDEVEVLGRRWGKLLSGMGWICLEHTKRA